ncbi:MULTISPECIES: O-antigen polysaccharide polymerase Wzy family protein [unclassified Gemella]|uniref:O-antigen polysaccharide polymerase Wzy family protein n=1 Tax=unclassified Gemella TaxID=2624949 RepID=UPI001C054CA4|nr:MULTISPECIES: O-antigen polysaccharide polymerase Wzy family protein [unclassified Gemella]MBU0279233.1 O-antigen polysaccharide polymerase Wzy family protein [Gemella sp. zg-1178]QWQ39041.1 O-antigen polysaccharide polymerase Wzy family protein [Gemella sp. zg-570]
MNIEKKVISLAAFFSYSIFFAFILFYFYSDDVIYLLISAILLLVTCIIYTFKNLKNYIIHLIFYLLIFLFLLSLPTIDYFKTGYLPNYQNYIYEFCIKIIMLSVISIFIGGLIGDRYYSKKKLVEYQYDYNYIKTIRIVAVVLLFCTYPAYLALNIEKVLFKIKVNDYYLYFATFESKLPLIVHYLGNFAFFILIFYLATKPKKLYASIVLLLYVFANFIILLTGTRNPFILSLIFSFVYYFVRNQTEKGKWIGYKEKVLMAIFSLPIIVIMSIINYTRDGKNVGNLSFIDIIIDFIYKQGSSFNVLAWGYMYQGDLPNRELRNYTFGSIIDYIYRGKIGNLLFNSVDIPSTDRLTVALESNSLAHNLSYIVYQKYYLEGHGIGDSYVIGNYIDFGYVGVILMGIILGFIFVFLLRKLYIGKIVISFLALVILTELFFTPRGSFSASFSHVLELPLWFIILLILLTSNILKKNKAYLIRR